MFRKTLVVRALAVAFGATALSLAVGPVAFAQTSATGTVYGQVDVVAGSTVVIESVETGARRTLTPGADGRFQATSMPVGQYRVTLQRNGTVVNTRDGVQVSIGQGTEVSFTAVALQAVQITGGRKTLDMSSIGSTTTFSASELAKLPIAANVGSVIQLAPQTTSGDSRYGGSGAPSFGGAGASENAYYINGFPVTTLLTQVGFSQLPFNSIAQTQLLTGGYGAEFGRSTGGVVNIVTKKGGNDVVFGWGLSVEPSDLRATPKSIFYEKNGRPNTDGKYRYYNGDNTQSTKTESFYFGAPLLKDKVFLFLAAENTDVNRQGTRTGNSVANVGGAGTENSVRTNAWQEVDINKFRGLLKLDWNITEEHSLEYTHISDEVKDSRRYFGFDYNTLRHNSVQAGGDSYLNWGPTPVAAEQGADVDILKYTGYLTDDFTFTAVLGKTRTPHGQTPENYNPSIPQTAVTEGIPGFSYPNFQNPGNQLVPGAFDENQGIRLDGEWRVNSIHTLRGGIDYNKIKSLAGTSTSGGSLWTYGRTDPAVALDRSVPTNTVTDNPYAQQGYYVTQTITSTSSTPTVIQSAAYIEDKIQATERLLLSVGLRNEAFDNRNGDNQSYIKLSKQLAPRLGAAWDVKGDASLKVTGSAGRYHVPVPTNVAIRGAGASLNTTQNFVYTGVDQTTGAPTGVTAISPVYSPNNEFGQSKDPRTVAAQNMKGNYQDELSLGFDQAVSKSLLVGAKVTYRTLRTAIDDFCDDRPFKKWAADNGVDASGFAFNCALFNPGRANTFTIDIDGDGTLETVNLSAADLGFPKVKREYFALDLSAEYPFDGKLWGKVNYTWSRSKGNTEGQLLSDIGQGDVATTQAFDFPDFSVNANGLLPNDRTHQIKAFGYFQADPEWGFGANLLWASGRPRNCIGNAPTNNPDATDYSAYGPAYFFCNGNPSPRGSLGRLQPTIRVDLNVAYRPSIFPGLTAKVDLFNAFNRQSVEAVEERYNEAGGSELVRTTYGSVISYSAPRYVKLSLAYDYKF